MQTNKVLVVDAAWVPHHWATWEEAVIQKYKGNVTNEIGDPSVFHGGTSRMTGERTEVSVGQIIFLKEALKYTSRVPPLTNDNLFARDLNMCAYCGRRYIPNKLSRDHIHPVSKGGENTWKNCVTACKSCNHAKADDILGKAHDTDGEVMNLLFVPYVPSHAERLILSNRTILADQMEFLRGLLPKHSRMLNIGEILGVN